MDKVIIVTAHVEKVEQVNLNYEHFDYVICADGGLLVCEKLGLNPDIVIGDFDSMDEPKFDTLVKLPTEKDMTDSEAAIDLAISKGFRNITVLGGLGGRFDHTMGNIGMLAKYSKEIDKIAFVDGQNYVFMITPGETVIPKNPYKYLGIISYGGTAKGVTLNGTKYPLSNFDLTPDTSLGVSNEISDDQCKITFNEGLLLIVLSKDC